MTGFPWSHGDAVLAADLNAAILNAQALGTPSLPLIGGTLSGPLLGTTGAFSGATFSALNGLFSLSDTTNGRIALGNTAVAHTPFLDFMSTGTATAGFRIISTGANNLTFQAGAVTNVGSFSAAGFASPLSVSNNGASYVFSGADRTWLNYLSNVSGTHTGGGPLNLLGTNSDTIANTGGGASAILRVQQQFGGAGTAGSRLALDVRTVMLAGGVSDSGQTYMPIQAFNDAFGNAGGTGLIGALASGAAYAIYPQVWLHPGATNYAIAAGSEWDIAVEGTKQPITIGTGHVSPNVITLTFTSATIAGSPLAVSYTVGASNTQARIVSGLAAAVFNNAALIAAGVSAQQDDTTSSVLNLSWPTQNTVSAAIGTTGSGVLTPGAVTPGASTKIRNGMSIARKEHDSAQGALTDFAFKFSDSVTAYRGGQWRGGVGFGGEMWPIAYNGTMIGASVQTVFTTAGLTGAIAPNLTKYGIDWRLVNYSQSGGASITVPGFSVDGLGSALIGNAKLTASATGLSVDVTGGMATGNATVVAGGGGGAGVDLNNYFVGDLVFDDLGGQHFVATTNASTGAVLTLTTAVQPSYTGASPPTTTRATTGGSGLGLTIGIVWNTTTATTLALQPSAGATTIGGTLTTHGTTVTGPLSVSGLSTLSGGFTSTGSNLTGTLSGANSQFVLGGGGVRTYSGAGSASQGTLQIQNILRGTVASGFQPLVNIWASDDGALAGSANEIAMLQITDTLTAAATGARWGIDVNMGNTAALAAGGAMSGVRATTTPQFNMGGTDLTFAGSSGNNFGANIVANATGTATFLRGVTGLEVDIGVSAGASTSSKQGIKIVLLSTDANQGNLWDFGLSFESQVAQGSGPGLRTGIVFGGNGGFGISSTGTLINAFVGTGTMLAGIGIDWSGVTFSTAFLKSTGFLVDGSGNVTGASHKVGANQVVGARDTGWTAMTGTPDKATAFATSTVTLAQLAGRVMQLQASLTTHGLIGT